MIKMTATKNPESERQYFIDWLRILLIMSVFLFHIGMIFNTWHWHIKNNEQYGGMLVLQGGKWGNQQIVESA